MSKIKILFVEDDLPKEAAGNMAWTLLCDEGYDVIPARTGQEAWNNLIKMRFNLIIFDIMLPPNHGAETPNLSRVQRLDMGIHLLKKLRAGDFESQGTFRDVAVVVVSAVPGVDRWDKIRELVGGDCCCLVKPVSPHKLIEVVRQALGKEGSIREVQT